MVMSNLEYHPIIRPFVNSFASTIAGILGWRLMGIADFQRLLEQRGGDDRVALASVTLEQSGENVTFSFRSSVEPLVTGESDHHRLLALAAQQLIGHCWELLRNADLVPLATEPVLEFFRHIRNGCFHGNAFHFLGDEPRNTAEWCGLAISANLNGHRIFRSDLNEASYFLNWGDPILLLSDVSRLVA